MESKINAGFELRLKEGFVTPDPENRVRFGNHLFKPCAKDQAGETTHTNPSDSKRILRTIQEATEQADLVVVSIHSHQGAESDKFRPAAFFVQFAHECIDAGAHAVVGHGPHVVRGIEIYRRRPIFFSLGNFIFQNDLVEHLPLEFYEKYGINPDASAREALRVRSKNGAIGLGVNPSVWRSVIAEWEMREGVLRNLVLHPVSLGFGLPVEERGIPELDGNLEALDEIVALSTPMGTQFEISKARAVCRNL